MVGPPQYMVAKVKYVERRDQLAPLERPVRRGSYWEQRYGRF